ncbi:protein tweety-like isoform X3 [Centruroides vittatus]|uniref:protein tweety-like isoform X3 n=1 Tax=Centruroides vittatus TaxID=120091 RepID=UPI00351046AE
MQQYANQKYNISQVANWFHAFPHVDITFSYVNATFDPSNSAYLEALGILIAIPGFWLILTLLAFLIFFLCRCCDGSLNKKKKLTPLKWTLAIFALLCCGALSVGLFGNDQEHSGMETVQQASENMAEIASSVKNETIRIQLILENDVNPGLDKLKEDFKKPLPNTTVHDYLQDALKNMRKNVSTGITKVVDINKNIDKLDLQPIPDNIKMIEIIRWPVTIAALCVLILVCVILLWGVIRHSRCLLILFSVLGLLSVVICWISVSLYLGSCVAASDFCLNPEPFFYKQASGTFYTSVLKYYLNCDDPNPFEDSIEDGKKAVHNVQNTLAAVTKIAVTYYPQKEVREVLDSLALFLNRTEKILSGMDALLNCNKMHKEYETAMGALCTGVLEGTAFMLVSAAGAGILFTVLIWVASHTWIHIRKKNFVLWWSRRPAEPVDEEDPFLPSSAVGSNSRRNRDTYSSMGARPRYSHTPPQTPHFTASLNGRSGGREDQPCLQGRYTPPPAYEQL